MADNDDSLAKEKMDYAILFFQNQLKKNRGIISNRSILECVTNIKYLFGDGLNRPRNQNPFVMIDMSKTQFSKKNVSKAILLIHERLEDYGIPIENITMDEISKIPEFSNQKNNNSSLTAGHYVDALINYQYPELLSNQKLPRHWQITVNIDKPTFNHPIYGEINNGIIVKTGLPLYGMSVFIYYYNSKNKLRIMHLYHLLKNIRWK
jgi:hypothetical protein